MKIRKSITIAVTGLFLLLQVSYAQNAISPINYGLNTAKSGEERYRVLYKAHSDAIKQCQKITYKGIRSIDLIVPKDARPIPLPDKTEFCGVKIYVKNDTKDMFLFERSNPYMDVDVTKEQLNSGYYGNNVLLNNGFKLLLIEDQEPWVNERLGYNQKVYRKDIVLLRNGRAKNEPITGYSSVETKPKFYYSNVTKLRKEISDVTIIRSIDSKFKTYAFLIRNEYNVQLSNVKVHTPESDLYGDQIISVKNCAKIVLKNVVIEGTYSKKNKYGYGISLDNVWHSSFYQLKAAGNWGIFGNNNVNHCQLKGCDINRFDVHCYGKNVFCKNTVFRDYYNQVSSFYGKLSFEKCHFVKFVPVLIEPSYNAYTNFDIVIKDCIYEVDAKRPYLVETSPPNTSANTRVELSNRYLPGISIEGLRLIVPDDNQTFSLYEIFGDKDTGFILGNVINIKNLHFNNSQLKVEYSNNIFYKENPSKVKIKSSDIMSLTKE